MNIETIISVVTLVVAAPPTAIILHKWYMQRWRQRSSSPATAHPTADNRALGHQSQLFYITTHHTVSFGIQTDDGTVYGQARLGDV
ncbi:hypothetical protein CEP52_007864 [Fusarium oligoseptatum]|uniref:Uncharacterized protein n=1 Tax=Fusarium oligoseptatum TaxID=2604345 RepID=A0A428TKT1_9HYPO|nr:hypothetical protein CEP52_007864 [Fusarium oligoseptatum]